MGCKGREDLVVGSARTVRLLTSSATRLGEEGIPGVVRSEQRFEALAQGEITGAFAVQPRRALRNRLHQRQCKQGFFVRGGVELVGVALQRQSDVNDVN